MEVSSLANDIVHDDTIKEFFSSAIKRKAFPKESPSSLSVRETKFLTKYEFHEKIDVVWRVLCLGISKEILP